MCPLVSTCMSTLVYLHTHTGEGERGRSYQLPCSLTHSDPRSHHRYLSRQLGVAAMAVTLLAGPPSQPWTQPSHRQTSQLLGSGRTQGGPASGTRAEHVTTLSLMRKCQKELGRETNPFHSLTKTGTWLHKNVQPGSAGWVTVGVPEVRTIVSLLCLDLPNSWLLSQNHCLNKGTYVIPRLDHRPHWSKLNLRPL